MKSKNIVRLFFSTLLLGIAVTLITSFFVKAGAYAKFINPFDLFELFGVIIFFAALGAVFSLVSQMGFFAYLTVNQLALGMFRSYWGFIQIILIIITLFDLVYFRYKASETGTIWTYVLISLGLLIYSLVIARKKAKETNQGAFIPALFFMVVVTSIEWVPALRTSGSDYSWLMIVPLLCCNAYQLLRLHHLIDKNT
ncbi:KinB-signaling pathway activation protein [Aquibacillus salsiterrae]|uniref:KinB-signaling pathway activation protein n=1 Tax=Aquibacillus salsiterrae TaxID=2950439 RepID=A0A9X4AFM9_9BACI|nr:KinB-signaling pathway activation protein [Aquibacillus salsiterrae]MDC3417834.1 KinB-signaling pathway activation protein [Aquibacillus salsiterrae]